VTLYDKRREYTVTRAEAAVQTHTGIVGWNLYLDHGCIWLTSEHCADTPQPGERVRLDGFGFGYPITGIEIGGRRYR
jgi:hypothetical protein